MLHVSLGDKMGLSNFFFFFLIGFEYSMLFFSFKKNAHVGFSNLQSFSMKPTALIYVTIHQMILLFIILYLLS